MDLVLSQRELASQLGVSKSSIENWEGNETGPARRILLQIDGFLGRQPSESTISLAERLTTYRRSLGFSQEELARSLGVHRGTVVRWEMGRRYPRKAILEKVKAFLVELPGSPGATPSGPRSDT